MPFQLPPPRDWQHFEDFCWRLWTQIWNDPSAQKNGRLGQAQAGVDVFGLNQAGDSAGVQCKGKDSYTSQKLTTTELKKEVEKAKGFKPPLSEYIIATTAPRDAKIQETARVISERHRQQGLFSVQVYGWEDIVDRLSDFSDLYRAYLRELRLDDLKIGGQRLPRTTGHLYGREAELQSITEAWESDSHNVLSIVAWGGVGKTALVKHWLGQMAVEKFRGAERVFTWSFYSQGAKDQAASADQFIDQALRFFEDPADPTQGSLYEKGERLADLVSTFKTLLVLVLDGLESLQYPSGPLESQLKDPALQILMARLSLSNLGLCLVTTQAKLSDTSYLEETTAPVIELRHLSTEVGVEMVHRLGVRGTSQELRELCRAFDGHALALSLLGTYLAEVHCGEVWHWKEIPLLDGDASKGGHARRVMQSYQKRLGNSPEWSLLRLVGFFDRPAKGKEIHALLAKPPIGGLTRHILKLDSTSRKRALARLRRLQLLVEPPPDDPDGMDAHPLVREFLSEQIHQHHPEACREGHRRLYEHLKQCAKELPETLEEMMPLYQALAHGCRAGLHQEAYRKVYKGRTARHNEHYAVKKLGALGADLAAISNFFERPWDRPSGNLSGAAQAFLLNQSGMHLRALGRLLEAAQPMRSGLEARTVGEEWKNAAISASNLSELHQTLGNLPQALDDARHSVELADRSGDVAHRMINRTTLAEAGTLPVAQTGPSAVSLQHVRNASAPGNPGPREPAPRVRSDGPGTGNRPAPTVARTHPGPLPAPGDLPRRSRRAGQNRLGGTGRTPAPGRPARPRLGLRQQSRRYNGSLGGGGQ